MNENILDDNLDNIDKPFVRTERIQQIETIVIVGSIVVFALQIWSFASIIKYFFEFGITSLFVIIGFSTNLWILAALVWWRKISMEYDTNTNLQRIELPALLKIARIGMLVYAVWTMLGSVVSIRFLFLPILDKELLDNYLDITFFLRLLFSFAMAFLYIYYWRITKQSMDFINK